MEKSNLRLRLKSALGAIPADERVRKSKALGNNLIQYLNSNSLADGSMVFGVFAPLADEPDWTLSPELCALKLAFPRPDSASAGMVFHQCSLSQLVWEKCFGVRMLVPPKSAPQVQPGLLWVPGLGFTPDGHRLGRGGGFYDRWLVGFSGKKIGLCFVEQLLQTLPTEKHDVVMDVVVTDERVRLA